MLHNVQMTLGLSLLLVLGGCSSIIRADNMLSVAWHLFQPHVHPIRSGCRHCDCDFSKRFSAIVGNNRSYWSGGSRMCLLGLPCVKVLALAARPSDDIMGATRLRSTPADVAGGLLRARPTGSRA